MHTGAMRESLSEERWHFSTRNGAMREGLAQGTGAKSMARLLHHECHGLKIHVVDCSVSSNYDVASAIGK